MKVLCCGWGSRRAGASTASRACAWPSPRLLLLLLCAINIVFFLDRGLISSNGVNGANEKGQEGAGSSPDAPDAGGDQKEGIAAAFDLSLFEDGLVAALYFVGVMLGAPIFAELSRHYNAQRLLGIGTACFAATVLVCGFSYAFAQLLVFRCLVGAATGSLIALGPPLIDDHAPTRSKALWLGVFYLCIPVGEALGYLAGGAIGSALGWRAGFWIEAGLAVPCSLWCLLAVPAVDIKRQERAAELESGPSAAAAAAGIDAALLPAKPAEGDDDAGDASDAGSAGGSSRKTALLAEHGCDAADPLGLGISGDVDPQGSMSHSAAETAEPHSAATAKAEAGERGWRARLAALPGRAAHAASTFAADLRQLARHPACLCAILGLTSWNAFLGAVAYFGPEAAMDLFGMEPEDADFVFGAVLVVSGVVGSVAGGLLLDVLRGTMPRGMALSAGAMLAGCILAEVAVLAARSQAAFWPVLGLAALALFAVQAPANAVIMWSVPGSLRPFALSISEVMQHLLGDIPSPPALGAMQGAVDDWRLSLAVFALLCAVGGAFFAAGTVLARRARDYREVELCLLADDGEAGQPERDMQSEMAGQPESLQLAASLPAPPRCPSAQAEAGELLTVLGGQGHGHAAHSQVS